MITGEIKNKNLGQGKRQGNRFVFFCGVYPSLLQPVRLTGEGPMKRSWVERSNGKFNVMTGDITHLGFTNVKRTDRFETLESANAKADLCNYVWEKCRLAGVR